MGKDKLLWKYLSDGLSSYFIKMIALKVADGAVAPELSRAAQADAGHVGGHGLAGGVGRAMQCVGKRGGV